MILGVRGHELFRPDLGTHLASPVVVRDRTGDLYRVSLIGRRDRRRSVTVDTAQDGYDSQPDMGSVSLNCKIVSRHFPRNDLPAGYAVCKQCRCSHSGRAGSVYSLVGRVSRQGSRRMHSLLTQIWGNVRVQRFYSSLPGEGEGIGIFVGDPQSESQPLVRIHSRCLFGEVLRAVDCDCAKQFELAAEAMRVEQCGLMLYLEQEGRGCGLAAKVTAHELAAFAGGPTPRRT